MVGDHAPPGAPKRRSRLKVAAGIAVSFSSIVIVIVVMMVQQILSFQMAMLMLVALLGLYVGFGVLIAIHHLIRKLE